MRYILLLVVAAFLTTNACVHSSFVSPTPPLAVETVPVPPAVPETEKEPPEKEAPKVLVVETDRYRLFYPLPFIEAIPLEDVLSYVEEAFDRVEAVLGKFDKRVDVFIPGRIVPDDPDFPKNLSLLGLCWQEANGEIKVLVSLFAADGIDTFAHEFMHARLRDLKLRPAAWFEEGIAHYMESADGFNPSLWEILEKEGPLTLDEAKKIDHVTDKEMQLRATAWALVYYLLKVEKTPLKEVIEAKTLPDPKVAVAAIKKLRTPAEKPVEKPALPVAVPETVTLVR